MKIKAFALFSLICVVSATDYTQSKNYIRGAYMNRDAPINSRASKKLIDEDIRWQNARSSCTKTTFDLLGRTNGLLIETARKCNSYATDSEALGSFQSALFTAIAQINKEYLLISQPGYHLGASGFNIPESFKVKCDKFLSKRCDQSLKHLEKEYSEFEKKVAVCVSTGVDVGVTVSTTLAKKTKDWFKILKQAYTTVNCKEGEGDLVNETVPQLNTQIKTFVDDASKQLKQALLDVGACISLLSLAFDAKFQHVLEQDVTCDQVVVSNNILK